jgi:hypothetical protein
MTGSLMMRQSVVVLLVGMLAGIVMGIQQNSRSGPRMPISTWSAACSRSCSAHRDGLGGDAASVSPCHFLSSSVA